MIFSTKMMKFLPNFLKVNWFILKILIHQTLLSEDQDAVSYWEKLAEHKEVDFNDNNRITTMEEVFNATDMSMENITDFTKEILGYCKENLAKAEAFIPSPFVSKYLLDEVNASKNLILIAFSL